jgi:DNA-binding LacI/PurR family transcriptional regulator
MNPLQLGQVDDDSTVPRYLQAKTLLAEAIKRGVFAPGAKLPNTSEIGAQMNVSLITAHRAIQSLEDEGWVHRERGRGTFVRQDFETIVEARPKFRIGLVANASIGSGGAYRESLMDGIYEAADESPIAGELVQQRYRQFAELDSIAADGFICFHPGLEFFERLEEAATRKSIVVLGASVADTSLHCVDAENEQGMREAVRHLVGLGHRRIGILHGPLSATNHRDRVRGYKAEMAASDLKYGEDYILGAETGKRVGTMVRRLTELMRSNRRPTAIVACGYYLALDVVELARRLEMRIPQDLSLIGFDDPRSAGLIDPPLTTVRQPLQQMGARAYARIVQLVHGEKPTPSVDVLPTSLIVRQSTTHL